MEISAKPQEIQMEMEMEMDIQTTTTTAAAAAAGTTNSPKANGSKTPTPPVTPRVISRSEPSTTFIQADTNNFKQVVQMLTGSSETAKLAAANKPDPPPPSPTKNTNIPPINKTGQKKQGGFKLYERRNSKKNVFMISPLNPDGFINQNSRSFSPRKLEILSPSMLDFPSLVLSPVTPLNEDNNNNYINTPSSTESSGLSEEEKAIAEKKFYLHPSPRTTPRGSDPPQLLPLFPLTSPRFSGSCSSDRNEAQTMCM